MTNVSIISKFKSVDSELGNFVLLSGHNNNKVHCLLPFVVFAPNLYRQIILDINMSKFFSRYLEKLLKHNPLKAYRYQFSLRKHIKTNVLQFYTYISKHYFVFSKLNINHF